MVMVLGAAALMLWPLLWPPDPDASVQLVSGHLVGETSGYVGRVNHDAQTVDVSSSLIGWRPIVLAVNEQTSILVQNRQGGFGDLTKDLPVRVSYEIVGDRRLARSIEIVADERESTRAAASGAANSAANGVAKSAANPIVTPLVEAPTAPTPVAPPLPSRPPAEAVPASAATTPVPAPKATPDPAPVAKPPAPVVAAPAPRVEPTRPSPPAPSVPPPTVSAPRAAAEASSRARSAPPAAETDSGDGAAAIDWLLKRR
jgi:hypothetical protein